jgi:hypothetical protein
LPQALRAALENRVMHAIREVMAVRYRELYGTTLGDPHTVVPRRSRPRRGHALLGIAAHRRLPLRAYLAGYTLKNGVPINYIEAIGLCEWIEVGFNTFYTYRQGETAWIYAQALRCLRALTGANVFRFIPTRSARTTTKPSTPAPSGSIASWASARDAPICASCVKKKK